MQKVAKFLTALAGAGAQLVGFGLVSGDAQSYLSIGIGLLTAVAVYLVPNAE